MKRTTTSPVSVLAVMALLPFVGAYAEDTAAVPSAIIQVPAAPGKVEGLYSKDTADFDGGGKEIRKVLEEISKLYGFNMNIPDDLKGVVDDKLKESSWQDFFTMILEKKGYAWRIEKNVVVIEKKKNDAKTQVKKLESGNISVNFSLVPLADAVTAICEVMDKNLAPLPADLLAPAPGAQPAAGAQAAPPKLITIKWKGVSWQRTLAQVLAVHKYGYREDEGVIQILPLEELNNVPSESRVYRVNFADAGEVAKMLTAVYKPSKEDTIDKSELTATGEATQQLVIVVAKPDFLRREESRILSLITQVDQPPRQVMIESRVVESSVDNNFQLGFRYAWGAGNRTGDVTRSNAATQNGSSGAATLGGFSTLTNTGGGPFSMILSEQDFKFFMDALEQDKTTNVLQNPTLIVKDAGKGAIRVIRREPYFEQQTTSGTTTTIAYTTKFINVGTSLYVSPKIKGNDFIELNINQEAAGGRLDGGGESELKEGNGGLSVSAKFGDSPNPGGGTVPITDNRDVRTTVNLRDGYTVVLGGIAKDSDLKNVSQVPVLGDIPVIGRLFQSNSTIKTKTSLMAFITARVIDPYNTDYRDIIGLDRINSLGLTAREIEGYSYKTSEAERDALKELLHKRELESNALKSVELNRSLNGDSGK